jgi:hypothetical protein
MLDQQTIQTATRWVRTLSLADLRLVAAGEVDADAPYRLLLMRLGWSELGKRGQRAA